MRNRLATVAVTATVMIFSAPSYAASGCVHFGSLTATPSYTGDTYSVGGGAFELEVKTGSFFDTAGTAAFDQAFYAPTPNGCDASTKTLRLSDVGVYVTVHAQDSLPTTVTVKYCDVGSVTTTENVSAQFASPAQYIGEIDQAHTKILPTNLGGNTTVSVTETPIPGGLNVKGTLAYTGAKMNQFVVGSSHEFFVTEICVKS